MIVTLRRGGRDFGEKIPRESIEQAWGFDLEALKIVPIDVRRVECHVPDEP